MDNYFHIFSSFCQLTHVGVNMIWASGVFNKNRLRKYTIIGDKQVQKKECGHFEQRSTHEAKTLCNLRGWLERQQGTLRSSYEYCQLNKNLFSVGTSSKEVYSKGTTKWISMLQPKHGFCQKNGTQRGQTQIGIWMKKWWW